MKKKVLALLLVLAMVFALAACGGNNNKQGGNDQQQSNSQDDANTPDDSTPDDSTPDDSQGSAAETDPDKISDTMTSADNKYLIAMVTDVGQLKDKSFNQGTWNGVKLYANANGISYKYYQPAGGDNATDEDRYQAYKSAIDGGAEVIVAPGFLQEAAMRRAAVEFPDVKFIFIDGYPIQDKATEYDTNGNALENTSPILTNVVGVAFHEEQCGYMAGYAAVIEGYTKLGFTGGGAGSNPAVNRYGYGFIQGAQAAASETGANVEVQYSYLYGEGYSASPDLQTQINGWYANGTEVVFACGGSMCNSVFAAAASNNGISIGVDVDQAEESNTVMTSAMKGLSEAASLMLGEYFDGNWDSIGGTSANLGVDDDAVGLPYATSRFEVFTEDAYNALVDGMKSGGSLEVKGDYDAFLAGDETFANVTVNFVK